MSDISGNYTASLNARPAAPESKAAPAKPNTGKPLPSQVVEQADAKALPSASLYTKAQEEQAGQGPDQASRAEELEQAVAKLNDYVQNTERQLNFQLDEDAGLTIIRVYDRASEELIRQIPSEEAVTLAQKLNQEEPLMLFSAQV